APRRWAAAPRRPTPGSPTSAPNCPLPCSSPIPPPRRPGRVSTIPCSPNRSATTHGSSTPTPPPPGRPAASSSGTCSGHILIETRPDSTSASIRRASPATTIARPPSPAPAASAVSLSPVWAGRVVPRRALEPRFDRAPAGRVTRLDSARKPLHDACEFSVSRSRRLVIVAVADDPVGLDIEAVPEPAVAAEALHLVHPRERAELDQLSGPEMAAEFARLWARKEAFLRAMSTGLARDP